MEEDENIDNISVLKEQIEEALYNPPTNAESQIDKNNRFFEQYKLLAQSTNTIEERRKDSNNIFIALNSVFLTFLTQTFPFYLSV